MKLLLTSSGITNKSIEKALLELLGKLFKKAHLTFIPTAANVERGDSALGIPERDHGAGKPHVHLPYSRYRALGAEFLNPDRLLRRAHPGQAQQNKCRDDGDSSGVHRSRPLGFEI